LRPAIGDVRSLTAWIVSCSTTLVESLEEKHSEREMLTQLCKEVLASAMSLLPLYTSGKIQEAFKRLQESTRAYSNLSTPNS
jgi:predicted translin family RNA/ssDNA-binding protein